ncbi:MAG TPA: hypothetical protein VMW63_06705 [Methanoregulaceae archaeon]|nr:hypothetical protein [Methanoregulaceae archaeon]
MNLKILALICGVAVFLLVAGCTQAPPAVETPTATQTAMPTTMVLTTEPTDAIPSDQGILVTVSRETLTFNPLIKVEFRGGSGIVLLSTLDVKVTRPDGTIETGSMAEPNIGDYVELTGSTAKDRVEVTVRMKNGNSYKIYDEIIEFRN